MLDFLLWADAGGSMEQPNTNSTTRAHMNPCGAGHPARAARVSAILLAQEGTGSRLFPRAGWPAPHIRVGSEVLLLQIIKVGKPAKLPKALFYFRVSKGCKALESKITDVKGCHSRAKNNSPPQGVISKVAGCGEIADESAGEGISGARGIEYLI